MLTIVGGGPGGVAAAVWARRLGMEATLIEAGERLGGALWTWTEPVLDLPGFMGAPSELAAVYARQTEALGVSVVCGCRVLSIEPGELATDRGRRPWRHLVLALGTRPRRPGFALPPEPQPPFSGRLYAVLGGGDGAASAAVRLQHAGARVVVLHRGPLRMQPRFRPALDCRRVSVRGCRPDGPGWRLALAGGGELAVDGVIARLGFEPAAGWTGLPLVGGRIRADVWGRTAMPGVYAVGDVSSRTPSARASVCTAHAQAMHAVKHLALQPGSGV